MTVLVYKNCSLNQIRSGYTLVTHNYLGDMVANNSSIVVNSLHLILEGPRNHPRPPTVHWAFVSSKSSHIRQTFSLFNNFSRTPAHARTLSLVPDEIHCAQECFISFVV